MHNTCLKTNSNLSVDFTCVNELDVPLQVTVNHEDLVAAGMRTWSLSHILMMLLDVLLKTQPTGKAVTYTVKFRAF